MNFAWERLNANAYRCRLPFLDVTVGLVTGSRGALLVDSDTTLAEAAAVRADVDTLTGRAITHVVLTHKHFDHVLGSAGFPDANLYATPEVAAYMDAGRGRLRGDAIEHGADADEVDRAIASIRVPDRLVREADIDLGPPTVSVCHPGRGHTRADLIVVVVPEVGDVGRTVVFCGDLIEESADPAIDEDSDLPSWPTTLDRVLEAGGPDAVYVPGHGAVVDARFVRRQQEWLRRRTVT